MGRLQAKAAPEKSLVEQKLHAKGQPRPASSGAYLLLHVRYSCKAATEDYRDLRYGSVGIPQDHAIFSVSKTCDLFKLVFFVREGVEYSRQGFLSLTTNDEIYKGKLSSVATSTTEDAAARILGASYVIATGLRAASQRI